MGGSHHQELSTESRCEGNGWKENLVNQKTKIKVGQNAISDQPL